MRSRNRPRRRPTTPAPIDTIYGRFTRESKRRLDLTFDYEAAEIAGFRRVAELVAPTLLIDIGANIGVYAVHLAGVASLRRILAFEPAPESFGCCERNLALQEDRPARRRLQRGAVGPGGQRPLRHLRRARRQQRHRRHRRPGGDRRTTTIEVPTARLDDRVAAAGETFLAKIDVEGHELQVLAGADRLLRAMRGYCRSRPSAPCPSSTPCWPGSATPASSA